MSRSAALLLALLSGCATPAAEEAAQLPAPAEAITTPNIHTETPLAATSEDDPPAVAETVEPEEPPGPPPIFFPRENATVRLAGIDVREGHAPYLVKACVVRTTDERDRLHVDFAEQSGQGPESLGDARTTECVVEIAEDELRIGPRDDGIHAVPEPGRWLPLPPVPGTKWASATFLGGVRWEVVSREDVETFAGLRLDCARVVLTVPAAGGGGGVLTAWVDPTLGVVREEVRRPDGKLRRALALCGDELPSLSRARGLLVGAE